jgi:hypothetical protein
MVCEMQQIILGLIVGFAGFQLMRLAAIHVVSSKLKLPALVAILAIALGSAFFLEEAVRTLYQFGLMFALAASVAMALLGRALGKAARKGK